MIACAESWENIALYGRSKLAWLRQFLALPNGIPTHDTFRRVFMLIGPQAFETCFTAWIGSVATPDGREVVAIDGKTVRRSFGRGREQPPLHRVSTWASKQGAVLGQRCVEEKSTEITAIPKRLESLALENTRVTIDAMGCQKDIAQRIVDRQADYLLVPKASHGHDYAAVQKHFEQHCFGRGATAKPVFGAFDESHGRWVRRRVFASPQAALLETLGDWPQLHTVLAVEAIRGVNGSDKVRAGLRHLGTGNLVELGSGQNLGQ